MPREILEDIINDFSIKKFNTFFREKSGKYKEIEEKLSGYDKDIFSNTTRVGFIDFGGSAKDVAVIGVKTGKDLTERSSKKAQYDFAKNLLKQEDKYEAGIFVFYDAVGNFRFSLVYPQYQGKQRVWNNFRRFTYFVNKELTNKTFLQRIGGGDFSSLEKIKEAFSVEKVTKEFYLEYRKLFDDLLKELSKNHVFKGEAIKNSLNIENFSKKLLGQIIFLYFIQKKGWLGVPADKKWGEGDKNFMKNLFEGKYKKYDNFFDDILEHLFYEALNKPTNKSGNFFRDYFGCQIPFLNGGLFEAEYDWENSKMCLDNKIFRSIFDVFERYNFTVEEESPDDKEVAVDPEMLGKVFENLLPENLRKGKGTYYTPREIVYYMCRESLVNYLVSNHSNITEDEVRKYIFYSESLENFVQQKGGWSTPGQWKEIDDLLSNIKICDPACGSGAFLVGMLNMIVKLRIFLQTTPDSNLILQKKECELKRETIQNCIYGVDIDPGAIEIAKLRLWLALVVDYDIEDIEPLPNLDYRLMCGNSLLEEFEGVKFYNGDANEGQGVLLGDPEKDKKIKELEEKIKGYFNIHDDKVKKEKQKEINSIKDWLIRSALEKKKKHMEAEEKKAKDQANWLDEKSRNKFLIEWGSKLVSSTKIQEVLDNLHNPKKAKPFFIWKLEFVDVFEDKNKKGFDIIIANPPYLSSKNIDENLKPNYEKIFYSPTAHYDIYIIFFEKALQLLGNKGNLCFITSNKYFSQKYGEKIRELLLRKHIIRIINFNFKVFEATVDTAITIIENNDFENGNKVKTLDLNEVDLDNKSISSLDEIMMDENRYHVIDQNFFKELPDWNFRLDVSKEDLKIWKKIHNNSISLSDICFVIYGAVLHNADKKVKKEKFIYEESGKDLKPYVEGKYISRWRVNRKSYLQYTPAVHREPRYPELFENHKLIGKRIIGRSGFSFLYDKDNLYTDNTVYIIIPYHLLPKNKYSQLNSIISDNRIKASKECSLLFLLTIINSSLFKWLFQKFFSFGLDVYPAHIKKFPIKIIKGTAQKSLIKIVDKILDITKSKDYLENTAKQAKVKEYEKQIDQVVYKLYDLDDKEIKIIEDSLK